MFDTGIGISLENIEKLFQPFIQIDSALNREYSGTGLGLALVRRIVELHGGQVGVTSEVEVGSCFTIKLPCTNPEKSSLEARVSSQDNTTPNHLEEKYSELILLVEDNEANIHTISSYLKAKGYRVLLAKNGHEAIAMAGSEKPNLIWVRLF
ncbi:Circadian input kinase A [Richelia intracellularis]|nr:Circadian input kinase A [Richelia intracellularis]